MLKDLVKLSNKLDSLGLHKEANFIDSIAKLASKSNWNRGDALSLTLTGGKDYTDDEVVTVRNDLRVSVHLSNNNGYLQVKPYDVFVIPRDMSFYARINTKSNSNEIFYLIEDPEFNEKREYQREYTHKVDVYSVQKFRVYQTSLKEPVKLSALLTHTVRSSDKDQAYIDYLARPYA